MKYTNTLSSCNVRHILGWRRSISSLLCKFVYLKWSGDIVVTNLITELFVPRDETDGSLRGVPISRACDKITKTNIGQRQYRKEEEDAWRGRKGRHVRDLWQLLSPFVEFIFPLSATHPTRAPRRCTNLGPRREQTTSEFVAWWTALVCLVPSLFSSFLRSSTAPYASSIDFSASRFPRNRLIEFFFSFVLEEIMIECDRWVKGRSFYSFLATKLISNVTRFSGRWCFVFHSILIVRSRICTRLWEI